MLQGLIRLVRLLNVLAALQTPSNAVAVGLVVDHPGGVTPQIVLFAVGVVTERR